MRAFASTVLAVLTANALTFLLLALIGWLKSGDDENGGSNQT